MIKKIIFLPLILLFSCSLFAAPAESPDKRLHDALVNIDSLFVQGSSHATMTMTITSVYKNKTKVDSLNLEMYSKGTNKTIIEVKGPANKKGYSTLKLGNKVWNYLPNSHSIIPLNPALLESSWLGSDISNGDLVNTRKYALDYDCEFVKYSDPYSTIKCVPHEDIISVWGSNIFTYDFNLNVPLRNELYDYDGVLVKYMKFDNVKTIDGSTIPTTIGIHYPDSKNNTVLNYDEISFDVTISDSIFSLAQLRKGL